MSYEVSVLHQEEYMYWWSKRPHHDPIMTLDTVIIPHVSRLNQHIDHIFSTFDR